MCLTLKFRGPGIVTHPLPAPSPSSIFLNHCRVTRDIVTTCNSAICGESEYLLNLDIVWYYHWLPLATSVGQIMICWFSVVRGWCNEMIIVMVASAASCAVRCPDRHYLRLQVTAVPIIKHFWLNFCVKLPDYCPNRFLRRSELALFDALMACCVCSSWQHKSILSFWFCLIASSLHW
jgi:hypothetical protein